MSEKSKTGRSVPRFFGQSVAVNPQTGQSEVTGAPIEVRLAHPFLHEKRTKSAGGDLLDKPRNDVVVMVPKIANNGDCPNYRLLSTMLAEAAYAAWGSWPTGYNPKIQDGDIPHRPKPKPGMAPLTEEQIIEKNKWRCGHWIIEASSAPNNFPAVGVMQNGQVVDIAAKNIDGVELYKSGDYGIVKLNAWTFEQKSNFGVNFGLDCVIFTRPGERIGSQGGPRTATQMYGAIAGMVTPSPAPMAPAAPMVPAAPVAPQYAAAPPVAPTMAPPPPSPAPQYAAAPAAPPAPGAYAPPPMPPVGEPPMPPAAPVAPSAPGLPPFPGR